MSRRKHSIPVCYHYHYYSYLWWFCSVSAELKITLPRIPFLASCGFSWKSASLLKREGEAASMFETEAIAVHAHGRDSAGSLFWSRAPALPVTSPALAYVTPGPTARCMFSPMRKCANIFFCHAIIEVGGLEAVKDLHEFYTGCRESHVFLHVLMDSSFPTVTSIFLLTDSPADCRL